MGIWYNYYIVNEFRVHSKLSFLHFSRHHGFIVTCIFDYTK